MFIKTAIAFVLILFTTDTLMAGSKYKNKAVDTLAGKCLITEFHEKGDVVYALSTVFKIRDKECKEKAESECSIFSLRVEYVWENSQKQTIECEVKK